MSNLENVHTPEQPDENPYRARILHEAAQLITGDRQKDYGPPEENFKRIAEFWTTHLRKKLNFQAEITARDVAELMILLKVARMAESPTEDSYKDAAGYAGIGAEIAEAERELARQTEILVAPGGWSMLKEAVEEEQIKQHDSRPWPGIKYPHTEKNCEKDN